MRREYKKLTKKQLKALQTLAPKFFGDVEERRDWLEENYGTRTFGDLNMYEAGEIIQKWSKVLNAASQTTPTKNGGRPSAVPSSGKEFIGKGERGSQHRLTQLQADRINLLAELLDWNMDSVHRFIFKQINRDKEFKVFKTVDMLMNYEAVKVIVGMEHIAAGNLKVEYKELNSMDNILLKEFIESTKMKSTNNRPRRDL